MKVGIKGRMNEVKLPERAHTGDAGLDIFAAEPSGIEPGDACLVRTGPFATASHLLRFATEPFLLHVNFVDDNLRIVFAAADPPRLDVPSHAPPVRSRPYARVHPVFPLQTN